jgi:catechol 2,3-dioxygenase-like lactoylglutathione lyase family enzyme
MQATFRSVVLFVGDMAASRRFYEGLLGLQVDMDLGVNVGYTCGLALWQARAALEVIHHHAPDDDTPLGRGNLEVYFEVDDLDAAGRAVEAAGVPVVHPIVEQPWAQRVLRVHDPDGHIVEIAEPMHVVVGRLASEGLDAEGIRGRTYMPIEVIEHLLAGGEPR